MTLSTNLNGFDPGGDQRADISVTHDDLWGRGHKGSASLVTSLTLPDLIRQAYLTYSAPVSAMGGSLEGALTYSDDAEAQLFHPLDMADKTLSAELSWRQTLSRTAGQSHFLTLRGGYRSTDESLSDPIVDLPISIEYEHSRDFGFGEFDATVSYTRNLPWGLRSDGATDRGRRGGADSAWDVWRADANLNGALAGDWSYQSRLAMQMSDEPLVAQEQFALLPSAAISGFTTPDYAGDVGASGRLSLTTPVVLSTLRLAAFTGWGWARRRLPEPGGRGEEMLGAAGVGVQLAVNGPTDLAIGADLGWIPNGADEADSSGSTNLYLRANFLF